MRLAPPLLAVFWAILPPLTATAALSIEQGPAETPAVERRDFVDQDSPLSAEKKRRNRIKNLQRTGLPSNALGIAAVVVPLILIGGVAAVLVKRRNADPHRATLKKLKQAEARRRAGGPEQPMLDPRQW